MCDWPNREAAMSVVRWGEDMKPSLWCDPCLEPLVRALNDGGLRTVASCCGHGRRPSVITLEDGRQILVLPDLDAYSAIAWLWPGINDEPATLTVAQIGGAS